ncbi:MAG: alanine racemase [bacterium]|nr:alanine racemase [bacterium]
MLKSLLLRLKKPYKPLNRIEISKQNFIHNYHYLSSINKNNQIAPVFKSNAYGHGLKQIAQFIDELKAPFICVDSIHEGYELLKEKVITPILIMGYIDPENLKIKKLPFMYAIYDKNILIAINKYQPHAQIHLFIDTGMHREGILLNNLPGFLTFVKNKTNLKIDGLMSHFAMADKPNNTMTNNQITNFKKSIDICNTKNIYPKWIHINASNGILHIEGVGNIARAGIAIYGIDPSAKNKNILPVLKLKSKIVQIKQLNKNEYIGYDFTFKTDKNMTIAILPIGYNDGVDRRLSNKGIVTIDNIPCPIVGKVSMNMTTVDISKVNNPFVGQEIIIYDNNPQAKNSIFNTAATCETIPYEILIHLNKEIKRVLYTNR